MQGSGLISATAKTSRPMAFPLRFVGKLVLEVLPPALASIIGGFVFTQYQLARPATPQPSTEQAEPASPEMMQLVRDEHALLLNFLKAQTAAEQNRTKLADEAATASAEKIMAPTAVPPLPAPVRRPAVAAAAAKPAAARTPMVIARAEQVESGAPGAPSPAAPANVDRASAAPAASDAGRQGSLVGQTLAVTGHVVAVTLHAVSVIGGIPAWIGNRIGGPDLPAQATPRAS